MLYPHPPTSSGINRRSLDRFTNQNRFSTNDLDYADDANGQIGCKTSGRPNIFISAKNRSPVYIYAPANDSSKPRRSYAVDNHQYFLNDHPHTSTTGFNDMESDISEHYRPNKPAISSSYADDSQIQSYEEPVIEKFKSLSPKRVTFDSCIPKEDDMLYEARDSATHVPNRSYTTYRNSFDPSFLQEEVGSTVTKS